MRWEYLERTFAACEDGDGTAAPPRSAGDHRSDAHVPCFEARLIQEVLNRFFRKEWKSSDSMPDPGILQCAAAPGAGRQAPGLPGVWLNAQLAPSPPVL